MNGPLTIALHFLKFRPRSEFEVQNKLRSKKYEEGEIEKTINVLKQNKLLNDAEFAKMWVRNRNLLKPTGSYLLKLELKRLGVAEEDIEVALLAQDEEKLAKQAIESKTRYRQADFRKQAAFLQRRGFGTSVIYKILKQLT